MFLLLVLAVAYFLTTMMIYVLIGSPFAFKFGDAPNHRKVHQQVVPRLGGLGMIIAFLFAFWLRTYVPDRVWPRSGNHLSLALLFIGGFLAVTGSLDDLRNLSVKVKFAFQFVLASGIALILGHHFGTISMFGHSLDLNQFGIVLTIFWIVAVMNAFNIIDGIDGLAGGVAICGFGAAALMAHANGGRYLVAMNVVFIGLTLGFLRFNFSRTHKVFLGDAGSQFLGAVVALMSIEVQALPKAHFSILVPMFIVGYPLFDISLAMIRRFLKPNARSLSRRFSKMFVADNEHLHHRLVYLGLSHLQATSLLLMVAVSLSISAVIIARVEVPIRIGVCAYLGICLFLIMNRLGYIGLRPWLTFPRWRSLPPNIVGVIEPDDVFFHSLQSFKQDRFEFLSLSSKVGKFMGHDLVAVMIYNAAKERFEEQFTLALRATEYHDRPAILIAESADIKRVQAQNPEGFKSIHFIEKPVHVPELIRELERYAFRQERTRVQIKELRFSLAELALRNNARD